MYCSQAIKTSFFKKTFTYVHVVLKVSNIFERLQSLLYWLATSYYDKHICLRPTCTSKHTEMDMTPQADYITHDTQHEPIGTLSRSSLMEF